MSGARESIDGAPVTDTKRLGRTPSTARGRRTHRRLVTAAHEVFIEQGYFGALIDDIVERAEVSHGTFYTYFASKLDVFRHVALDLQESALGVHDQVEEVAPRTIRARIERANRRYLEHYRRNARMFEVLEQVAALDESTRQVRLELRREFVARSARMIERLQRAGASPDDVDAWYVANALGAMVDRLAYVWLVLGEEFDMDELVRTVSELWVRAAGVDPDLDLASLRPS